MLGCVCLTEPGAWAWTGGGPLERIDRESASSPVGAGCLPPETCLAPGSLRGGVGACSARTGAGVGPVSAAPSGPRGSAASSTDWRMVDAASTFFAGGLRPPGARDGVEEVAAGVALLGSIQVY